MTNNYIIQQNTDKLFIKDINKYQLLINLTYLLIYKINNLLIINNILNIYSIFYINTINNID